MSSSSFSSDSQGPITVAVVPLGVGVDSCIPETVSAAAFTRARDDVTASSTNGSLACSYVQTSFKSFAEAIKSNCNVLVLETNHYLKSKANRISKEAHEHFPALEAARLRQHPNRTKMAVSDVLAVVLPDDYNNDNGEDIEDHSEVMLEGGEEEEEEEEEERDVAMSGTKPQRKKRRRRLRLRRLRHMVFARGPNLNPARPDYLGEDATALVKARQLLELTYSNVIDCCEGLYRVSPSSLSLTAAEETTPPSLPPYAHPGGKPPTLGGNWRDALWNLIGPGLQARGGAKGSRDARLRSMIYYEDEDCVVAYDGYPKAQRHLLLMPRPGYFQGPATEAPLRVGRGSGVDPCHHKQAASSSPSFSSSTKAATTTGVHDVTVLRANDLVPAHLPRLRRLHAKAHAIAAHLTSTTHPVICVGYHAIPSLEPLHVHIISADLVSVCLKKKEHFNSFVAPFFVDTVTLENDLDQNGGVQRGMPMGALPAKGNAADHRRFEEMKKRTPLVCTTPACNCGRSFGSSMADLKRHLEQRRQQSLRRTR